MKKQAIYLIACLALFECFDIFSEQQQLLIGDISLINTHNQEDRGYKLVLAEPDFNSNILEDYVIDVNWNDSMMLVKGLRKDDCMETHYTISHNKGKNPLQLKAIGYSGYLA